MNFLKEQATNLGLPCSVCYPVNNDNPVVMCVNISIDLFRGENLHKKKHFSISWIGKQPCLPSIMLNSHMDVVPVFEEFWTHPPFAADIDETGRIYARGAQDMKSIGTQYLAAIRSLKRDGIEQLERTVHVIFVPDEEINGEFGMAGFVESKQFADLKVGFALDEGDPSATDDLILYYGERPCWGKCWNREVYRKRIHKKKFISCGIDVLRSIWSWIHVCKKYSRQKDSISLE